jgi:exosortase
MPAMRITTTLQNRGMSKGFLLLVSTLVVVIAFYGPLKELAGLSRHSELYSHIPLMPVIAGYLLYQKRKDVFPHAESGLRGGIPLLAVGSILSVSVRNQGTALGQNDYLSLMMCAAVITWIGGFICCLGGRSFRASAFPTLFLLFTIPIPSAALERIIFFLQQWSAEVSYAFFRLIGIPICREGFVFNLTGLTIEVAKQCSSIRSSLALFIMGVLLSGLFLRTMWARGVLLLAAIPLAILKNGIRIVTLTLLGLYVDERFLIDSPLHQRGGIVFFLIALSLLVSVMWALRKWERRGTYIKDAGGISIS